MKQIYANNQTLLQLGRQGENLVRQVVFDLSSWVAEYGSGVAELIYQRNGDAVPYPVAAVRDGNTLVWTLTATDTAVASSYGSNGHCELRYYAGDVLAKSATWPTKVIPALSTPSETAPPEPEQGWVDQIIAAGAAAKASEANAAGSASAAAESATAAQSAQSGAEAAKTAAAQSAQEAAESAAVYDNVVSDVNQLKQDKAEKTALAKTDRSLDALWKLNQGISYQFETDESEAYSKTVPSGAKLASVGSIGGKTIVWNQLADVAAFTGSTSNGITYTVNNGKVYATGTATTISWLNFGYSDLIKGHVYFYTGAPKEATSYGIAYIYLIESTYAKTLYGGSIITFDKDTGNYAVRGAISAGVPADNWEFDFKLIDLTQMFGSGNEPTSTDDPRIAWIEQYAAAHPEYNAGELVSADVESVVERGRNLLNLTGQTETVNGITIINNGNGTYTVNGTATKNVYYRLCYEQFPSGTYRLSGAPTVASKSTFCLSAYQDDVWKGFDLGSGLVFDVKGNPKNIKFSRFEIVVSSGTTVDNVLFKPMITVYPSEFNDFEPYHLNTYAIPASVCNLPGYGWSAGSVRNSIERTETGWKYVQRVGSRDYQDGDTVTDGVTSYYVLDIPVITDITDLMEGVLDAITVEAGGTLTFENAAKLDVPNTVEYAVKLSEVGA